MSDDEGDTDGEILVGVTERVHTPPSVATGLCFSGIVPVCVAVLCTRAAGSG